MFGTQEVESYEFCHEHVQSSRKMLIVRVWLCSTEVKPGGEFINLVATAYPLSKSVCFEGFLVLENYVMF